MEKLSLPQFAQRYEYVKILPDVPFVDPENGVYQEQKNNIRYQLNDRTGIYDWYNAYFECNFLINAKANKANGVPNAGPLCGSQSLIRRIAMFGPEGDTIYESPEVNKASFVKKLLTQSRDYAETVAQDEFWYLDKTRAFDAERIKLTDDRALQNVRIPLKNYSFFESMNFSNILLSGMQLVILVDIENEAALLPSADARLVIRQLNLWVPLITLHPEYLDNYTRNITKGSMIEWSYRREKVFRYDGVKTQSGSFRITGIVEPRKVIYYFINKSAETNATESIQHFSSLFKTSFGIGHNASLVPAGNGGNPPQIDAGAAGVTLNSARVEIGSDNIFYPRNDYKSSELGRMYYDTTRYAHIDDNDMGLELNRNYYRDLYSMIYIDLDYRAHGVIQDNTDIVLHYDLSGPTYAEYYIFGVIEYMNEAKFGQRNGTFTVVSSNVSK